MIRLTPREHVCREVPKAYPKCCEETFRIAYHIGHEDGAEAQFKKVVDILKSKAVKAWGGNVIILEEDWEALLKEVNDELC